MHATRLSVAVADAMPREGPPAPPPGAEPEPKLPPPPPVSAVAGPEPVVPDSSAAAPVASPPRRRGPLASLLRRPAEYVRAYLTASVDHQFRLLAEREAQRARAAEQAQAAAHAAEQASARAAEQAAADDRARAVGLEVELATLAQRLSDVEQLARDAVVRGQALSAAQVRAAATADHAVIRLDQILGVLGPRLDELEIKVRPLVELDGDSVAVRTGDGYVVLPRSEPLFVTAVADATSGGLEPGTRRVLRALLRPGDACADVGANVGLLTVAMAFAVGPSGRVWAFEPEARVRAQLERTLHLNGLSQVTLSGEAVGARAGRLTFHQSPIIGHSSLYALPDDETAAERAVEVAVTTLDAVVPPGVALAAVKIDVEGAELDVLAGMRRVIAESPDLAVVAEFGPSHLRRTGVPPEAWFAAFADHGLAPHVIAEPGGLTAPVTAAALADVESANLAFVRPGGAAQARLPR